MPKTPLRNIRIDDELWDAAKATAEKNGETVTQVIRRALSAYVKGNGAVLAVLATLLLLSACGGEEPAAQTTSTQTTTAEVSDVAASTTPPFEDPDAEARALAGECYSTVYMPTRSEYAHLVEDISSQTIDLATALVRIPDPSEGCDGNDVQNLTWLETRAHDALGATATPS